MLKRNITLGGFLNRVAAVKEAALEDLKMFDNADGTVLGLSLCCRDDEDAWLCVDEGYELFVRFERLMEYIIKAPKEHGTLEDGTEVLPADKFYWEVRKYSQIDGKMEMAYTCNFSMIGELLSLFAVKIPQFYRKQTHISDAQQFLYDNHEQLSCPTNVVLPYMPGDILHIDGAPFCKSFDIVYCAESLCDEDELEYESLFTGVYERDYPCLYIDEDDACLGITLLTLDFSAATVMFKYTPLDRITVVTECDEPLLKKASKMLKENPRVFREWLKITGGNIGPNKAVDTIIRRTP